MMDTELSESTPGSPTSDTGSCSHGAEAELDDGPTNCLRTEGPPVGLEHVYDYEPGGHQPVHLGDTFHDGRYRVLHKLGSGGYANVWLCRDLAAPIPKYVALKILMAEASAEDCREMMCAEQLRDITVAKEDGNFCVPLRHFRLDGPNGSHLCFVYAVMGPKVSSGLLNTSEDPDRTLREICRVTVKAMALLHTLGICHGDFTPNNVLQYMPGLDGLQEESIFEILGKPEVTAVVDNLGQRNQLRTAPQYLVYPVSWRSVDTQYFSNRPCVTDFGEAFKCAKPPKELGIPVPYRSPELLLEKNQPGIAGLGTDLWALGCTLFEIRTGRKLFSLFDDDEDAYLDAMVEILGVMSEPWWSTTWEGRRKVYEDEPGEDGRAVYVRQDGEEQCEEAAKSFHHPSVAQGARSIKEKLAAGVWYMSDDEPKDRHREMSEVELALFADLLGRLLRWKPEERESAEELPSHEWFQM